ncbi:hypothetical protein ABAC402_17790 [Asticcacaulis sp. AC402]|nr:hypothetical protein ABAC402_17790 [Asticcacaulis sp. AC402]
MGSIGKTPSLFKRDGTVIGFAQWTKYVATGLDMERWSQDNRLGICIQTRRVRGLDIDVDDRGLAEAIDLAFCQVLGLELPARCRSNSGKRLLAFIVEGDLPKRRMVVDGGIIELLGNGQQFVFAGEHVSGVRYEWAGGLPSSIPVITIEQLDAAWEALAELFATEAPVTGTLTARKGIDFETTDPVAQFLVREDLVLGADNKERRLHILCPWDEEHTPGGAVSSTSWLVGGTDGFERGHFKCMHAHCAGRGDTDFLDAIGYMTDGFEVLPELSPAAPSRRRFEVVPAHAFASGPPMEWFIKGVLPRAGLGVIYGASTAGKSFIALDMVACVARGVDWKGHKTKPGKVVYVAAEGASGFRTRLNALSVHTGVALEDLGVGVVADAPDLFGDGDADDLTEELCLVEADLVVIDTLARTMVGGDENSAKDMSVLVARCEKISRATGAMVILVHHSGKDATKGARGSSALKAAADFEAEVSRDGDARQLKISKLKDGEDGSVFDFRLKVIDLGVDEELDKLTSCAIEYVDAPKAGGSTQSKTPVGSWQKAVWGVAQDMAGVSDAPIDVEALIDETTKILPPTRDSKGRDRRRNNVARAVDALCLTGNFLRVGGGIALQW